MQGSFKTFFFFKEKECIRVLQRNRANRVYTEGERYTLRNWLMLLWRLGKSKIFRVGWQAEDPDKRSDLPGGTVSKNLPANAGDTSLIPGPGRFHMLWSN